jgi:hypothetical protein
MDPNATLAEMLDLAEMMNKADSAEEKAELGVELALRVFDLNEWFLHGGALPDTWAEAGVGIMEHGGQ